MAGDGIYTRYLGHYLDAGRYHFNIMVDDNDNSAFYVLEDKASKKLDSQIPSAAANLTGLQVNYGDLYYAISAKRRCCGSSVLPSLDLDNHPSRVERTGIFRRSVLGPVIHLISPSKASDDKVPPSRIGDLKIRQLPGASTPDRLMAEWTAPGGDFDEGSVASYRFVFSSKMEDLLNPYEGEPEVLLGFDRIERAGTAAKFDFNFPHYDTDFYVGAYCFDIAGNRGKISNLVHVRIAAPKYIKTEEAKPILSSPPKDFESNLILIGSVCGGIAILLIITIVAFAYCIKISRGKKSAKTGSTSSVIGVTGSDETDSSSFDSDIKNIMSNPLGPALALPRNQMTSQPQPQYTLNPTPPSHVTTPMDTNSTNVTPVYWSASQLLSKLDHSGHHHPIQKGYYVPTGPQSLQLPHHPMPPNGMPPQPQHQQQPVSLHNISYEARPYNVSWSYNQGRSIPEEYTITVEDASIMPSAHRPPNAAKGGKVPPPVMPKPRNVSQV